MERELQPQRFSLLVVTERYNGKPILKSLKTTVFSVAKQRLPDTMREHRAKLESVTAVVIGKMTVGDAARVNVSLKPRSKDYREVMIDSTAQSVGSQRLPWNKIWGFQAG